MCNLCIGFEVNNQTYITKEGWLSKWAQLVSGAKNLSDFPLWLQYFAKVLFQVINRSGMYDLALNSYRMVCISQIFTSNRFRYYNQG